jgi:hypothetical protein
MNLDRPVGIELRRKGMMRPGRSDGHQPDADRGNETRYDSLRSHCRAPYSFEIQPRRSQRGIAATKNAAL